MVEATHVLNWMQLWVGGSSHDSPCGCKSRLCLMPMSHKLFLSADGRCYPKSADFIVCLTSTCGLLTTNRSVNVNVVGIKPAAAVKPP